MPNTITSDTQAVLLLCGGLTGIRSLTPSEYNLLAEWLKERSLCPADLLKKEIVDTYRENPLPKIDIERMEELLGYGGSMAIQVEQWLNNGFWITSRSDDEYPVRLKKILGLNSPPLLFGVGSLQMLSGGGVAIVGSRDVDDAGAEFADELAEACARNGINIVSGGARGVDQIAMAAALNNGGRALGVLANDLAKAAVISGNREAILNDQLVLVSPYHPKTHFQIGNAMARNKVIYGLADVSVVVSSTADKGGTWQGAIENLKKWNIPLYVREAEGHTGNGKLIEKGGEPFPIDAMKDPSLLIEASRLPARPDSDGADNSDDMTKSDSGTWGQQGTLFS